MSLRVKAEVPEGLRWAGIIELLGNFPDYKNADADVQISISEHYAWLLQVNSWKYDLNWCPKESYIELEVPLVGKMQMLTEQLDRDIPEMTTGISRDQISYLLARVISEVPVSRLMKHFQTHKVAPTPSSKKSRRNR